MYFLKLERALGVQNTGFQKCQEAKQLRSALFSKKVNTLIRELGSRLAIQLP
jgi:hypothetical protein